MPSEHKESRSRVRELGLFARNFVKHPRMLGSVIPSSRFLIERVLSEVDWGRARVIVEYGPGVGTFTREILARLHPGGTLLVFETNPDFVQHLLESISDPRLQVVHASAATVHEALRTRGLESADYLISGIPFSTLPKGVREEVLTATRSVLNPRGAFLVYQFASRVLLRDLRRIFSEVRRSYEPLNVFPAQVFFCRP
jgi:phospholipid N-methyltransferase